MENYIIGVDPGSEHIGFCVLYGDNIVEAVNLSNTTDFINKVMNYKQYINTVVVIEDIKPYSLQLTPNVIDTCKVIGEMIYRLKNGLRMHAELLSRYDVKKWCFDTMTEVCTPIINRKIDKKSFLACSIQSKEEILVDTKGRKKRSASFVYVDDKVVIECMKHLYKIPLPPPGKGYAHGLKTHSWQALALVTCFKHKQLPLMKI